MNDSVKVSKTPHFWLNPTWEGAFWKMASCACFAGINAIVRYLGGTGSFGPETGLPVNVMLFFQNVFGFLWMLCLLNRFPMTTGGRDSFRLYWKTTYPKLHFFRVLTAVLGILFLYLSLQKMSIAESVALSFTGPAFTVLGARLLLGESMGGQRWLALTLSLLGVFIISYPELIRFKTNAPLGFTLSVSVDMKSSLGFAAVFPLLSAVALAISKLLTRQLTLAGESPSQLTLFLLLGMIPISFVPACYEWVTPTYAHWLWLMLLGLLAVLAHIAFGKAYALAEVTFLMPFGFSKFLFSLLLGYYCFLEIPSNALWLGMSIIGLALFTLTYKIPLYSIAKRFKSN